MAKGIRALLDTVMQALPQVGNLGLLFFLLFFIFAALGVELFGRLECSDEMPCQGLGEHAHFSNFGMAFLTLFRVATGDNWNGIMKDTLRDNCDDTEDCIRNCCVSSIIAPIFFVIFVLMAQFVLVNVVVAVLMKHLEESHKQMEDELDMEFQLERELLAEQEELLVVDSEENEDRKVQAYTKKDVSTTSAWQKKRKTESCFGLSKVRSLPSNFIYNYGSERSQGNSAILPRDSNNIAQLPDKSFKTKSKRTQSFYSQKQNMWRPPLFELLEPRKKESRDLNADNSSHRIISYTSNYLFPPTISYTSRSKDMSTAQKKSEQNLSLKTSCAENSRRNSIKHIRGERTYSVGKEIGDDFDVQSIINERRPLNLKVNSPQIFDSNSSYYVTADNCDSIWIDMVKENSK